jgi:hypothetical protein
VFFFVLEGEKGRWGKGGDEVIKIRVFFFPKTRLFFLEESNPKSDSQFHLCMCRTEIKTRIVLFIFETKNQKFFIKVKNRGYSHDTIIMGDSMPLFSSTKEMGSRNKKRKTKTKRRKGKKVTEPFINKSSRQAKPDIYTYIHPYIRVCFSLIWREYKGERTQL